MDEKFKSLRRFYENAMKFLQKGKDLAKKIFFSDEESAEKKEEPSERSTDFVKTNEVEEGIRVPEGLEVTEDSKAARRYIDRFYKMKAAERELKKAEDKYNSLLLEKQENTNQRRVSQNVKHRYDVQIAKSYCRLQEAEEKLKTAIKKLERDKKRYEETL